LNRLTKKYHDPEGNVFHSFRQERGMTPKGVKQGKKESRIQRKAQEIVIERHSQKSKKMNRTSVSEREREISSWLERRGQYIALAEHKSGERGEVASCIRSRRGQEKWSLGKRGQRGKPRIAPSWRPIFREKRKLNIPINRGGGSKKIPPFSNRRGKKQKKILKKRGGDAEGKERRGGRRTILIWGSAHCLMFPAKESTGFCL